MILLYANRDEVKYVTYEPKYCIGMGAYKLNDVEQKIEEASEVVLFGCSGWLGEKMEWNNLIELKEYKYVPEPVHDEDWCYHFRHFNYLLVDMESYQVNARCKKHNVPFRSIRYIIDRCDKRIMSWGINHFWRKYQHCRMQIKFNKGIYLK